jgi:hypothetical protein
MMQSLDHIRLLLEAEVKGLLAMELRQETWDYLLEEGHVARVQKGERTVQWLAERVLAILMAAGQGARVLPGLKGQGLVSEEQRRQADRRAVLSLLLAHEAANNPAVRAFRERVLKGALLPLQEVEQWIQQQAQADGPPTAWLEVPVPSKYQLREHPETHNLYTEPALTLSKDGCAKGPQTGVHFRVLDYGIPSADGVHKISTAVGGVLEQLRALSEHLALQYPWQRYQASLFVLTDQAPLVPEVSPSVSAERGGRITLDIDPALTPRQVADAYRRFRRQVLGGKRLKALSPKHLRLAVFMAERPEAEPWGERMEAWNRTFPDWKYEQESNFRRDTGVARKRLLTPSISWEQVFEAFAESPQTVTQPQSRRGRSERR